MSKDLISPFPVNGYFGPEYFCDRDSELKTLDAYMKGKVPVVLIGVRRLGKSGLIKHLFHQTKCIGVYVDLQKSTNLEGLVNVLAEGIAEAFPESKYQKIWTAIKSFRPSISFDPLNGTPQFSFDLSKKEQVQQTLRSLFSILADRKEQVILAFDEFQEVTKYPEEQVEGILRAEMQHFPKLNYLFSGSQTNLLTAMFSQGNQPFFSNTAKLFLEKIDSSVYDSFISSHFSSHGKKIDESLVGEVLDWTENHTYYTQFVCNQLFIQSKKLVTAKHLDQVKQQCLHNARYEYFQQRELLSPGQRNLVYAVAKEIDLYNPTSKVYISKYKLGNSRGVTKNLENLVNKQLINRFYTEKGQPFYKLSNVFIMRYINGYL